MITPVILRQVLLLRRQKRRSQAAASDQRKLIGGGKSEHHRTRCHESIVGLAGNIPQERKVSQKKYIPAASQEVVGKR